MKAAGVALLVAAALLLACGAGDGAAPPADARPDLQIVRVRMDLMAAPASKLVAEIRNAGASAAHGFDCRCSWSCPGRSLFSTELRVARDAALGAGATGEFSVDASPDRFGCPGPPPAIDMSCTVDDRGAIDESDENNNGWTGPIRLGY
jgi:hypothetical protein